MYFCICTYWIGSNRDLKGTPPFQPHVGRAERFSYDERDSAVVLRYIVKVIMPHSKLHMSLSSKVASNGTVTEHYPPFPDVVSDEPLTDESPGEKHTAVIDSGRLPEEVYANTLPRWRAALRRKCVAEVEWESEVIATWQVRSFLPSFLLLLAKG